MASSRLNLRVVLIMTIILIIFAIVSLYALGFYFANQCASISDCRECWNEMNITDKNNAYVEMISCACGKAKYANYGDSDINRGIEIAYRIVTGNQATVSNICEGNVPLTIIED